MTLVFRFPDFLEPYADTYKFLAKNSRNEKLPFVDLSQTLTFIKGILIKNYQSTNQNIDRFVILEQGDYFYSDSTFKFKNFIFGKHDQLDKQLYYTNEKNEREEITFEVLFDLLREIPIELIKFNFIQHFKMVGPRKTSLTTYPIIISFLAESDIKHEIAVDLKQMLLYSGTYCDMCSKFKKVSNIHVPFSCTERTSQCLQVFIEKTVTYKELINNLSFDEYVTMLKICDFLGIAVNNC